MIAALTELKSKLSAFPIRRTVGIAIVLGGLVTILLPTAADEPLQHFTLRRGEDHFDSRVTGLWRSAHPQRI